MRAILGFLLAAGLFYPAASRGQAVREGDIVFQTLPCGSLCDAILATTPCTSGRRFNHCGLVARRGDSLMVIEAIGERVRETPLDRFAARDTAALLSAGRPRYASRKEATAAAAKARTFLGRPYDDPFLPGDSALYCSELVWESCTRNGQKMFRTAPMTFKKAGVTHPGWRAYYQSLGVPPPEGVAGINPCALATSDALRFFQVPKASRKP